mgnify:CR=1 FL=1
MFILCLLRCIGEYSVVFSVFRCVLHVVKGI